MSKMIMMRKEAPGGLMYENLADYVTYKNGYTISDAEFLDVDYIEFIENEIRQGSNYAQADLAFQVEQGLR